MSPFVVLLIVILAPGQINIWRGINRSSVASRSLASESFSFSKYKADPHCERGSLWNMLHLVCGSAEKHFHRNPTYPQWFIIIFSTQVLGGRIFSRNAASCSFSSLLKLIVCRTFGMSKGAPKWGGEKGQNKQRLHWGGFLWAFATDFQKHYFLNTFQQVEPFFRYVCKVNYACPV